MKLITAIVKPEITDELVLAISAAGARGLTATEVIGFGQQYGHAGPAQCHSVQHDQHRTAVVVAPVWV